jgi:hypothetical protein
MSLLTEQEIENLYYTELDRRELSFAKAIEAKVIEKIKAQGPAAWAAMSEEGIVEALGFNQSRSRFTTPIYRLPEGD